jgi:hypothetical protein
MRIRSGLNALVPPNMGVDRCSEVPLRKRTERYPSWADCSGSVFCPPIPEMRNPNTHRATAYRTLRLNVTVGSRARLGPDLFATTRQIASSLCG